MRFQTWTPRRSRAALPAVRPAYGLGSLLDDVFGGFDTRSLGSELAAADAPRVDVRETEKGLEVKTDLPGVEPDQVELTVKDDALVIRGERRDETAQEGQGWHRVERTFGSFERRVPLPFAVKSDEAEARFENGVLTIELPRAAEEGSKRIPVQG